MNFQEPISGLVERIARALERLAPPSRREGPISTAPRPLSGRPSPRPFCRSQTVNRVPLILLKGIDRMRDALFDNTVRFAQGLPANNALLWGARGTGKSSLVKAVHAAVSARDRRRRASSSSRSIARTSARCRALLAHLARDQSQTLHPVLRRSVLRGARHLLQVAESRARRRHRRPPRQLCYSTRPRTGGI